MQEQEPEALNVQLPQPGSPVTVSITERHIVFYTLSEGEMEALQTGSSGLNLAFFGVVGGGLVAVAITLATVSMGAFQHASFVAALIPLLVLAAFFGIQSAREYRVSQRSKRRIVSQGRQRAGFPSP